MNTKERIMDVALHMFAERGYEAVSIRDICGVVGIRESTLYYHYKNKQDILDSLVVRFEKHIAELISHLDDIPEQASSNNEIALSSKMLDDYMMDSYLFDPFCNLMIRLMMIEQFHNEKIRELYEKTMFTDPYEIQRKVIDKIVSQGRISDEQAEKVIRRIHAHMTMLTYRYLLNGELTEERKHAYSRQVHSFMQEILTGGDER